MIILDYNQIALSNVIMQKLGEEDMIRHMILNSIRLYTKKFGKEYGEVVIASDGKNTWRRDVFPQYKGVRKKKRDESATDWNEIFRIMDTVRNELKEYSHFTVLNLDGCEGDDITKVLLELLVIHANGVENHVANHIFFAELLHDDVTQCNLVII